MAQLMIIETFVRWWQSNYKLCRHIWHKVHKEAVWCDLSTLL